MPRLLSLRYVNIGYPTARCDDLWFPLTDREGRPTETTFWLRNGGGKSQTITLFFSLIRPTKREFLGQMADGTIRKLSDYILKGDRSVVAAEWELDGAPLSQGVLAGPRLVTGVFYERRDGRPSSVGGMSEEDKIEKLFFTMRVLPHATETGIGMLPIFLGAEHTQRRSLAGFRRAMEEIRARVPQARVTLVSNNYQEWSDELQSNGIDPELFQYQLRMNEKEGGADRLFADCTRVQDYVNLFLEILVDRRMGHDIRSAIVSSCCGAKRTSFLGWRSYNRSAQRYHAWPP
jgi:hypothetical protein